MQLSLKGCWEKSKETTRRNEQKNRNFRFIRDKNVKDLAVQRQIDEREWKAKEKKLRLRTKDCLKPIKFINLASKVR